MRNLAAARWTLSCATLAFSLPFSAPGVNASSTGVTGRSGLQGATCLSCHVGGSHGATMAITGPDTVFASTTHAFTVRINSESAMSGGFNVATAAGNLQESDPGVQEPIQNELTHTTDRGFSGGLVQWPWSWTAPEVPNTYTLYAAAVASNNNGGTTGDQSLATVKFVVVVVVPTGVEPVSPSPSLLLSNQPNPFRVETTLRWSLPADSPVRLTLFDTAGRMVRVFQDSPGIAGESICEWDGRDGRGRRVRPGVYFCRLETSAGAALRRIVFLGADADR